MSAAAQTPRSTGRRAGLPPRSSGRSGRGRAGRGRGCSASSRSRSSSGSLSLGTTSTGTFEPVRARGRSRIYLAALLVAHLAQVLAGRRTDQILLPASAMLGGISLLLMQRLPQDLVDQHASATELGLGQVQLVWLLLGARDRHDARDRRPLRHLAAPLQVHLGGGRRRAAAARLRVRHRGQRRAADAPARAAQRPAVGAAQGDPRRLPGRLPVREPAAPRRAGHARRPAAAAAAAVPRADGRDVGDRARHRRRPARPRRGAAVLRRLPGAALRRDRAGQPGRHRARPVRRSAAR